MMLPKIWQLLVAPSNPPGLSDFNEKKNATDLVQPYNVQINNTKILVYQN